ncbi:MAG: glycosyltransferase [Promethearchaeota archaeon]
MIIEIIIPTLNSEPMIKHCLKAIQKMKKISQIELKTVIVDGGSTDKTLKIAESFGAVIYRNARIPHTIGSSRKLGLMKASGDYVAFIDSDELLNYNWLIETYKMISQGYKLISGQIIPKIRKKYDKLYKYFRHLIPQKKMEYKKFVPRPIRCCETNLAKKIQFDPNLQLGEDFDFTYRASKAGATVIFNPDLIIYHILPRKFSKTIKKEIKYGKGIINLLYKHRNLTFLKLSIISALYPISPIYYHRIFTRPLERRKINAIYLILFGFLKCLMIFIGYLYYIFNSYSAYRSKK